MPNQKTSDQVLTGSNKDASAVDSSQVSLTDLSAATAGAVGSQMTFAAAPSAASDYYNYEHDREIGIYLNDFDPGSRVGSFWVDVNFRSFGGSVKVNTITIVNPNSFDITVGKIRWQASDGSPIYRGYGETINAHSVGIPWEPGVPPIPFSEKPFVDVAVNASPKGIAYVGEDRVYAAPPSYQYTPL